MKSAKMLAILFLALGLIVCQAKVSEATPMGTAFTYQGRLIDANSTADGLYDFRFHLYTHSNSLFPIAGPIDVNNVDVIDGYFTVELGFGSDVFDGDARWLEIDVRPGDSNEPNDFVVLSPRQEITPTPYALQTRGIFVDNVLNVGIGTTSPVGKLHVDGGKAMDGTWGADVVIKAQDGGDGWEMQYDGAAGGDIILLPGEGGEEYGVGFPGPDGNVGIGTMSPKARLSVGGNGYINTGVYGNASNYGVYGNASNYGVYGYNSGSGNYGYLGSTNYGVYGYSSNMWGMAGSSDSGCGVLGESSSGVGVRGLSNTGLAGYFIGPENDGTIAALVIESGTQIMLLDGNEIDAKSGDKKLYLNYNSKGNVLLNANGGNVGIGTTTPDRTLEISGILRVAQEANNARGADFSYVVDEPVTGHDGLIIDSSTGGGWSDIHLRTIGTTKLFVESGGNVGIGTTNPTRKLVVRGNILVQSEGTGLAVLELGEGLDYAEGFDVTEEADIEAGTVLVIDSDNPGKLTVGQSAYDSKVAGIVAGANGIGSGVRLGVGQFDYDVALAGRVYCKVDATDAAVQPGDLLTTSTTPGYAMKAADYARAQGAILGKAMESLQKGQKGQILVLVTLQ